MPVTRHKRGSWELGAGNWKHLVRAAQTLDVGDAEFKIRFPLELVLFERKGEIDIIDSEICRHRRNACQQQQGEYDDPEKFIFGTAAFDPISREAVC